MWTDIIHFADTLLLYAHIGQTLVNALHGLLNCEIGRLDWHVITIVLQLYTHVTPIV